MADPGIPPESVADGPDFPVRAGNTNEAQYLDDAVAWGDYQPTRNSEISSVSQNSYDNAQISYSNANEALSSANSASASASDAAQSADSAQSAANYQGAWSTLSGAYSLGITVSHTSRTWRLDVDLADVTLSEPGQTADWTDITIFNTAQAQAAAISF